MKGRKKINLFAFTKQERSGVFYLFLIVVLLQLGYWLLMGLPAQGEKQNFELDKETQAQIDSLKAHITERDSVKIYPFNPNYITDYSGYVLGLTVAELDRLSAYRSEGKFINSAVEFQQVTLISDSLLMALTPYFKFPDWVGSSAIKIGMEADKGLHSGQEDALPAKNNFTPSPPKSDLNLATREELMAISGIGEVLSARIIKFRDRLGGFLVVDQLYDVYGLEPEVVAKALERFEVVSLPEVEKINLNEASAEELSRLIYISPQLARQIIAYRQRNGSIDSFDELSAIEDFPIEKIERIRLYLSL
ncbi:MAG: helix-hairpin-helix domain-containing protein [Flavobacteriaceae bacterium]